MEIKPFFHYHLGQSALTYACKSCNFCCLWCQNWHISRAVPDPKSANFHSPKEVVLLARSKGDVGLCSSFTEPTLLHEFNLDAFRLAKKAGLFSCYVSNGYMSKAALLQLKRAGMDGLKIDIKGDKNVYLKYCGGVDAKIPWRNAVYGKKLGMHIELVNLIITNLNDEKEWLEELVQKHLRLMGPDVPIHFTRYIPAYKMKNPPTDVKSLEFAYKLAKKEGNRFPYIGDVLGHEGENTWCPKCNTLLIQRLGFRVIQNKITQKKSCPKCGEHIPMRP